MPGEVRDVAGVAIVNKVSALALLSNAVLVWNTVRIAGIVRALKTASGEPRRRTSPGCRRSRTPT